MCLSLKKSIGKYKYKKKPYDMHIYNFTHTKDIYFIKTNILQHCTEISNTKDSFKWQPLSTYVYIYIYIYKQLTELTEHKKNYDI